MTTSCSRSVGQWGRSERARDPEGREAVGAGVWVVVGKKHNYRRQSPHFARPLVAGLNQELVLGCRVVQAGGEFWGIVEISHWCHAVVQGLGEDGGIAGVPGGKLVWRWWPG